MKKETLIAVSLGILMGAIVAVLLIFNVREKAAKEKKIISPKPTPTIVAVKFDSQAFEISKPATESYTDKNTIQIEGKAPKNALLIFQSAAGEKVIQVETNEFKTDFPLILGQNQIKITSYNKNEIDEKKLQIFYIEKQ